VVRELVARRAVRSGALWGWVFGAYVASSALGFASLYKTQQARDELARSFGSSLGIRALIGPAHAINTAAGFTVWRSLGALSLVGSIWGLLTATRLLRGEEDAGRWELLLAGGTTQRRATAQALVGLLAGVAAMFAVTAVITVATGRSSSVRLPLGAALYFSLTLVAGAAVFLAIGALTSQLVSTRRRAASIAGAVFGASFALRMVADSNPSIHWLVWASPLGWVEETRPLTDPHPWVLVPIVALVLVAAGLALHLAGTRDVDAAVLPDRDVSRPRTAWLGSPLALAARLMRPQVVSWLVADAAFALLLGVVAKSGADATTSSSGMTSALARIGFRGAAIDEYLGLSRPLGDMLTGELEHCMALLDRMADDGGPRPVCELRIAVSVIAVAVRMCDNQFVVLARVLGEPGIDQDVDRAAQRDRVWVGAGTRVEQDRALVAEQQEDERCLEADRLAYSQDEGVPIALVHLDCRVSALLAGGSAVDPRGLVCTVDRRPRGEIDVRGIRVGGCDHERIVRERPAIRPLVLSGLAS